MYYLNSVHFDKSVLFVKDCSYIDIWDSGKMISELNDSVFDAIRHILRKSEVKS